MDFRAHQSFLLTDRSFLNTVRKEIHRLADSYGFNETALGKIDIVVSELSSNLVKHTTVGGELLVKPVSRGGVPGIEILCLDSGPGMAEPGRMLEDGVSTVGSQGEGLGAVKRLADEFDLYSQPGTGTVVLARLYGAGRVAKGRQPPEEYEIGVVMVPKPGEEACGDGWALRQADGQCALLAVDGLGHGPEAHQAALEASEVFLQEITFVPSRCLTAVHGAIAKTRGAVGAVAVLDSRQSRCQFCGIGNISGRIFSTEGVRGLLSYNGILGNNAPSSISDHTFDWLPTSLLVLHSDGLQSRWDLTKYPDIRKYPPTVIAAVLYRDFTRKRDDVLVIVSRNKR
jgi:anti-sigma regulatory factor (Ser/Thr protein kinase)